MTEIEMKLSAARTRLILDKPFLGALVLRLPMYAANSDWCKTTATDTRAFYYNEDYINALSVDQTQFVLAHEALHCALSHFTRRMQRNRTRWDIACDLAINPLLVGEGLKPPPNAIYLEQFSGMTAEEIYPCLGEDEELAPQDDHLYDQDESSGGGQRGTGGKGNRSQGKGDNNREPGQGDPGSNDPDPTPQSNGSSRPPPLDRDEQKQLAMQWAQRTAGAAQQARQAGRMSGSLARIFNEFLQPELPWRVLLARFMSATARDDYNYARPSRREGTAILPSLRSNAIEVIVALDISGSIGDEELQNFLSEVNALKGQAAARVTLVACDSAVADDGPWEYQPWEEFTLPQELIGGGSTDFRPVFAWVDEQGRQPDLLIYFTDGQGQFPDRPPPLSCNLAYQGQGASTLGRAGTVKLSPCTEPAPVGESHATEQRRCPAPECIDPQLAGDPY